MSNTASIDWSTIIAACLGAFVAIVGILISQYLANRTASKTLLRTKAEELYSLIIKLNVWIIEKIRGVFPEYKETAENPIEQIEMIVNLYFPSLINEYKALEDSIEVYRNALLDYYTSAISYVSSKKRPPSKLLDPLGVPSENAKAACAALAKSLCEKFKSYL